MESSASFVLDGPSYTKSRVNESPDGVLYPHSMYDAGIQIMANAFDWLLPSDESNGEFNLRQPPPTGSYGNPFLGLVMVCFSMIGLFFFDGYFGFSYLSSLLVRKSEPTRKASSNRVLGLNGSSVTNGIQDNGRNGDVVPTDLYEEAFGPYHHRLKLPAPRRMERGGNNGGKSKRSGQMGESGSNSRAIHDSDILSLMDNRSYLGGGNSNVISRRK